MKISWKQILIENFSYKIVALFISLILTSSSVTRAGGNRTEQVAEALFRHQANPATFAQRLPTKWGNLNQEIPASRTRFGALETTRGAFVRQRAKFGPQGTQTLGHSSDPYASPIEPGDQPVTLTGPLTYLNLAQMLGAGMSAGTVGIQPWSSDY